MISKKNMLKPLTKGDLEFREMFIQVCQDDKLREQLITLKVRMQHLTGEHITIETLFKLGKQMGLFDENTKTEL